MIRLLAILCGVLLLAGCGERVRVNVGAARAVYVGTTAHMATLLRPGEPVGASVVLGYYDYADESITLHEQLAGWARVLIFCHELAHAWDHQRPPSLWALLARYQSPAFDFLPHKDAP